VNVTGSATSTSTPIDSLPLDLQAPLAVAAPAGVAATVTAAGAVTLNWTAVAPVAGSTISYLVSVNGAAPAVVTGTRYTPAPALALGSIYNLTVATRVTKFGLATDGAASTPATVVDLTAGAVPVAPLSLTATATRVSWPAATGLSANAVANYEVQQSVNGGAFTTITVAPFTARQVNVVTALGNNYSYQVRAVATRYGQTSAASGWTSGAFNTVPVASTTPVAAAGAVGSKAITVTWTNPSSNITGFTVQRRFGGVWTAITPAITQTGTSFSFTDVVAAAGSYQYRLLATSLGGSTANTAASNAVTAP
jgi:hypothetical protein